MNIQNTSRRFKTRRRGGEGSSRRPRVEQLERRVLLAAYIWNSDSDGSWHEPSNWSDETGSPGVPSNGDTVTIDRGDFVPTILVAADARVSGLTADAAIKILGAELRVDGPTELRDLELTNLGSGDTIDVARLDLNDAATLSGGFLWNGGELYADDLTIDSSGSLEIAAADPANTEASSKTFLGQITNVGTVQQFQSVVMGFGPNSTVDNSVGGTWTTSVDIVDPISFRSLTFKNSGVLRKTGDETINIDIDGQLELVDGGRVEVDAGTLVIHDSGTSANPSTGSHFQVAAGALVDFQFTRAFWTGRYTGSGDGQINYSSGRFDSVGEPGAIFDFDEGLFHWTGGRFFGEFENRGDLTVSGDGIKEFFNRFLNTGTVTQQPGTTVLLDGTGIMNAENAVWTMQDDASLSDGSGLSTDEFFNAGTLRKTGTGTARIGGENNSATLVHLGGVTEVLAGTLVAGQKTAGTGGHFIIAADATFEIVEAFNSTGTYTAEGDGKLAFNAELEGGLTIDFPVGMATLSVPNADDVRDVTNNGWLEINGNGQQQQFGTFVNNGTFIQTAGTEIQFRNYSSPKNAGLWEIQDDASISFYSFDGLSANFQNFGTIRKTGASTTSTIGFDGGTSPTFNQSGVIDVKTGVLSIAAEPLSQFDISNATLHGGTWRVDAGATLQFLDSQDILPPVNTSDADVTLSSTNSSFPNIDSIAVNGGGLKLFGEHDFTTAGDFTNGVQRNVVRMTNRFPLENNLLVGMAVADGRVVTHSRRERVAGNPVFRVRDIDGNLIGDPIIQPGGPVSAGGLDITSVDVNLGGTNVPSGSLLFIHNGSEETTLYAIDLETGQVIASLSQPDSGVDFLGIALHSVRQSVYVLGGDGNVSELDLSNGNVLNSFSVRPTGSPSFNVSSNGGIDVDASGNLWVTGSQQQLRQLSPTGEVLTDLSLRVAGLRTNENLWDISIDGATGEAWLSVDTGILFRFQSLTEGTFGALRLGPDASINVAGDFTSIGDLTLSVGGRPITGSFSNITATGSATLGGTLDVVVTDLFDSVSMDSYQLIGYANRSGDFEGVFAEGFETIVEDQSVFAFADRAPTIDLVASSVSGPATAIVGDVTTIEWTVTNIGENEAVGPWYDEIRLRPVSTESTNELENVPVADIVVGGFNVNEGVTLAPGQSQTFSMQIPIVAALPESYYVVVETNRRGSVLETEGRQNNDAESAETIAVDFSEIPTNDTAVPGQFTGKSHPEWYKIEVPVDEDVAINLQMTGSGDSVNELYVARDYVPTRVNFDARQSQVGQANVTTIIEGSATAATWYVTAIPASFDGSNASFNISAAVLPPTIGSVSPSQIGNAGEATIEIVGARLGSDLSYRLVGAGDVNRSAVSVERIDETRVVAKFELDGLALGNYDIVASDSNGDVSTLSSAVEVEDTRQAEIQIDLLGATRVRSGRTVTYTIRYSNPSNVDMALPFITVGVEGGGTLRARYETTIIAEELLLFPPPVVRGTAIIPPGGSGSVKVYYQVPLDEGEFTVRAWGSTIDEPDFASTPIDWDAISSNLRPVGSDEASWNDYITEQRARYGETFADLYEFLADQVIDLSRDGFRNLIFVNGQWFFDYPETLPGPPIFRGIAVDDDARLFVPPAIASAVSSVEGESTTAPADGRQDIYAVIAGDPTNDLPGARRDARAWNNFFTKTLNIGSEEGTPSPIIVDTNGAKAEDFLKNIASVRSRADEDDLIFVTYAGHGLCRFDDNRETIGGQLVFSDRKLLGSELQTALAGETRTVAVIDACHSGAFTSEITANNVTSIAGADAAHKVIDSNSITQNLIPVLLKDPSQEIHKAVRIAGSESIDRAFTDVKIKRYARPEQREAVEQILENVRGGKADRDPTKSPNDIVEAYSSQYRSETLDSDGDGKNDFVLVDNDNNGTVELKIPDYNQDGEISDSDFYRSAIGSVENETSVRIDLLTFQEQQAYADYLEYRSSRSNVRRSASAVTLPVLDARGGELKLQNPEPKKTGGGAGDDVKEKQQTDNPEGKSWFRGERGRSFDPNEKVGPAGFGDAGFIREGLPLPFAIFFENDPEMATLPAQEVFITEVLDDDLDLTTFELGDIVVGGRFIDVPEGRSVWSTSEPVTVNDIPLDLQIDAELDFITRTVTWSFSSLDPSTGVLTELFDAGFLPPNDDTGRGEGNVSYTITPKADLASGSEISGAAEIVFDVNEPLVTNSTLNTIDIIAPTSTVDALPASSLRRFDVSWSGDDTDGSGVKAFDIYVSRDDGPQELWLDSTTSTSRVFTGEVGSTYAFQSFAIDNVDNVQTQPAGEVGVTIVAPGPWTNPVDIYDVNALDGVTAVDALVVINELGRRQDSDGDGLLPTTRPDNTVPPFYDVSIDGLVTALDALRVINKLGQDSSAQVETEDDSAAYFLAPTLLRQTITSDSFNDQKDDPEYRDESTAEHELSGIDVIWASESPDWQRAKRIALELEASMSEIASDVDDQWKALDEFFAISPTLFFLKK